MKVLLSIAMLCAANLAMALSTTDIDAMLQKETLTVEEGVWSVLAIKEPGIEIGAVFNNPKTAQFKNAAKEELSYGKLSKIIIEVFDMPSAFLYKLTGWDRYAFLSLVDVKLLSDKVSESKGMSGEELFSVIHRIKSKLYPEADDEEVKEGGGK
ncbi:MAG: hypothetical protein A2Y33_01490 [Spirochaetes bacterium GWF1_51_8]|nr:MAG: hypothetical protein A2Y33_01490 [Spirochaetes bacterium GWF1_51_8]